MSSDFTIQKTESGTSFDDRWLGSSHGLSNADTRMIDLATFASVIDANGYVPSGVAVAVTTDGDLGLFLAGDSERGVLAGFIYAQVHVKKDDGTTQAKAPVALLQHGSIRRQFLPVVAQRTSITPTVIKASTGLFVLAD